MTDIANSSENIQVKIDIQTKITDLLNQEPSKKLFSTIRQLVADFQAIYDKEQEELQAKQLDLTQEIEVDKKSIEIDAAIQKLIGIYADKRKAFFEAKKNEETSNLNAKQSLLNELRKLVEAEEHIGKAYDTIKEIHEKWKAIGTVPQENNEAIHKEYNQLNEAFYYNINIYKELKQLDLKKNYSFKNEIIFNLEKLLKEPSIKQVEQELERLQLKWGETGPTFKEEWPKLKEAYYTNLKKVFEKIGSHYTKLREDQAKNADLKEAVISKIKELAGHSPENIKAWNTLSKEVIALQEQWKSIGSVKKSKNNALWKEFRAACDDFFGKKAHFFEGQKQVSNQYAKLKEKLIADAEKLKTETQENWEEATRQVLNLQKEWKKIGHAGKYAEQRLWKKFRQPIDDFFDNKRAFQDKQEEQFVENLNKAGELLKNIKALDLGNDNTQGLEKLNEAIKEFWSVGQLPKKGVSELLKNFKEVFSAKYKELKFDKEKEAQLIFKLELSILQSTPDGEEHLKKEKRKLSQQLEKITTEINNFERNLSFFGKGAETLVKDANSKLEKLKEEAQKIEGLKKLFPKISYQNETPKHNKRRR